MGTVPLILGISSLMLAAMCLSVKILKYLHIHQVAQAQEMCHGSPRPSLPPSLMVARIALCQGFPAPEALIMKVGHPLYAIRLIRATRHFSDIF